MSIEIVYNDEFDKTKYPFGERVYDLLPKIADMVHHPDPENSKWYYFATIHGAILKIRWVDAGIKYRNGTLGVETIRALADLEGLRWIQSGENEFTIGLEFSVVEKD